MTQTVVTVSNDTIVSDNKPRTIIAETQHSRTIVTGIMGPRGTSNIQELDDVDISNLQNGSLLVYSTAATKWKATTTLDNQTLEAGQF